MSERKCKEKSDIVICISGMTASGKSTVARRLAEKYNLKYYSGGTILKELAISEGYFPSGSDWWETEEGRRFLKKRMKDSKYDLKVDQLLLEKAKSGGVLLDSWTMPWLCDRGLKIWIEASIEERARRLSKRDKITFEEALERLREKDEATKRIYKRLYGFSLGEDFTPFHIVLDNTKLSSDETFKVLCELIEHIIFKKRMKVRV